MKTLTTTTAIFLTLLTLSPTSASPTNPPPKDPAPTCGTCNPLSGSNNCDITTSCINTGEHFHCACRAGYKASADQEGENDHPTQFRLQMPHYEFLVFVPENTACGTLCEDPFAGPAEVCREVPVFEGCVV